MAWYVLYVKPQTEQKVATTLEKMGLTVYCPFRQELRQWSDRKKKVNVPLFKSYVFVKMAESERELVFMVPGVVRYLFWLGKPAVVRDVEIETLKHWLSDADVDQITMKRFSVGDEITLTRGAFKDQKAVVERVDKKQLRMIMKSLGVVVVARLKDVIEV